MSTTHLVMFFGTQLMVLLGSLGGWAITALQERRKRSEGQEIEA